MRARRRGDTRWLSPRRRASGGGTREARRLINAARERPNALFNGSWRGERAGGDGPPVLAVGTGLPMPTGPRARGVPLPLDVSKGLEALLGGVDFDIVHVHDPFAPSAASVALRHSRSLNVGSFHEPSERVLSTQVARPLVEIFFGRLDARTATCGETADLMQRYFPGGYELVEPGIRSVEGAVARTRARRASGPFASRTASRRSAARFGCSCARSAGLPAELDWEAAIWLPDGGDVRIASRLRDRVHVVGPAADGSRGAGRRGRHRLRRVGRSADGPGA